MPCTHRGILVLRCYSRDGQERSCATHVRLCGGKGHRYEGALRLRDPAGYKSHTTFCEKENLRLNIWGKYGLKGSSLSGQRALRYNSRRISGDASRYGDKDDNNAAASGEGSNYPTSSHCAP